ncbi:flagellar export chaperone FliS [Kineosporia sp. J2-2]|uniref:Flagellar export chaperone FliS n=1 Tax=Kineosporia corallincola TaxID=2835133 RepID=A0ABS5TJZ1_9ACTN|nr:flagellar export chaperone FliS [Kineosporia corallincola]MBT0771421.1 flagellar export chaperone FliS [Kineosporia corallincola]
MPNGLARSRYADNTAHTASPQRLLTMLYDRLIGDLAVAEAAMRTNDHASVGSRIQHAQDILLELWASLDTAAWPEGEGLKALYLWMVNELNSSRLPPQPERILTVRELLEPLRDTWKQAMTLEASSTTPSPVG